MARIPLRSGFTLIPEGVHVFRIYDVIYNENFGKLEIKMVNAQGITHTERFTIKDQYDEPNEGALNAFSYFAKTALNDFTPEDIDPAELIGHYIKAEVVHSKLPSRKDPTKTVTFANLGDKSVATGFEEPATAAALNMGAPAVKPAVSPTDLDDLLG